MVLIFMVLIFHRAFKICSTKTLFNNQIAIIKFFICLEMIILMALETF
jgi:hypothetical protein